MLASQFTAYEVFSIISGICMLGVALLPGVKGSERVWSVVLGVAFVGYGMYVAQQTSGTWYFPVWIFVIPVFAVIYGITCVAARSGEQRQTSGGERSTAGATSRIAAPERDSPTPRSGVSIPAQPRPTSWNHSGHEGPTWNSAPTPDIASHPAGWHSDPWSAGSLRYWDGANWTGYVR